MIRPGSIARFAIMPDWVADLPEESRPDFRFATAY